MLVRALDEAGVERQQLPSDPLTRPGSVLATFEYDFPVRDPIEEATIRIDPYLPRGAVCIPCG